MMRSISSAGLLQRKKMFRRLIEDASKRYFRQMTERLPQVQRESAIINADTKVLSLTIRPNNTSMWDRYADKNTGVVLRLRNADVQSMWSEARPVEYIDTPPVIFTNDEIVEHILGIKPIDGTGQFYKLAFTKGSSWSSENEWRIVSKGRDTSKVVEDLPFGVNEIDGVIFGLGTTDEAKADIRRLANNYPLIEFMQISRIRASFDLVLRQC